MSDLIKKIFAYLLPILRTVLMQTAAEELTKAAYPRRSRRYSSYNRMASYARHDINQTRRLYEKTPLDNVDLKKYNLDVSPAPFHDVLMVAFDISGPSANLAHEWLHNQMPKCGEDSVEDVRLDSWWVANDERFDDSDCDSAVFVSKGNQEAARELLRKHGLA